MICAFAFFLSCTSERKKSTSILDYVPKDAHIILKINDLERTKSQLRDNSLVKTNDSLSLVTYLKSISVLNKTKYKESLLCFSPIGKNNFAYTYVSKFDPNLIKKDSLSSKKIKTIPYDDKVIYKIPSDTDLIFATQQDSVLIASSSQILIENSIRQRNAGITTPSDLKKAYRVSSNDSPFSILLDGKKIDHTHQIFFPSSPLKSLSNLCGWASLDVTIDQNELYLDGVAMEKDSLPSRISIFRNIEAQENKIANITPTVAKGAISYTYNDYQEFKKNLAIAQEREWNDMPKDLDEILSGASEIGLIYLNDKAVFTLTALDPATTEKTLGGNLSSTYRDIPIYSYSSPIKFSGILHPLIPDIETSYYISYGEFMIFSDTVESLQIMIANILNKTLLSKQEHYKNSTSKISEKASIMLLGEVPHIKTFVSDHVDPSTKSSWSALNHQGYTHAILQVTSENNFAHIHGTLQKDITKATATSVTQVAATSLENNVLTPPVLVKNHRTKGMDVAIQDINNQLYLISDKGTIFWKKPLDGAILGEIKQIDIYKNGRYQLVFNTAKSLYVIDRNGNDVAPYPKRFSKTITQPLALFDYDKSKRYRLVVTLGNTIKMFDAKGEIVSGFGFKGTESDLILPPKHIRIGTKDHILICEELGKLSILDRLGRTRIAVKEKIELSSNEWFRYQDSFASLTKNGILVSVNQKGNVTKQEVALEENYGMVATNKTLVTLSSNKLTIKGKTIELDYGVYLQPQLFYINSKIYIALTDVQAKKVYLFDSNAKLFSNFPVYGTSAVHLGNMDKDSQLDQGILFLYLTRH